MPTATPGLRARVPSWTTTRCSPAVARRRARRHRTSRRRSTAPGCSPPTASPCGTTPGTAGITPRLLARLPRRRRGPRRADDGGRRGGGVGGLFGSLRGRRRTSGVAGWFAVGCSADLLVGRPHVRLGRDGRPRRRSARSRAGRPRRSRPWPWRARRPARWPACSSPSPAWGSRGGAAPARAGDERRRAPTAVAAERRVPRGRHAAVLVRRVRRDGGDLAGSPPWSWAATAACARRCCSTSARPCLLSDREPDGQQRDPAGDRVPRAAPAARRRCPAPRCTAAVLAVTLVRRVRRGSGWTRHPGGARRRRPVDVRGVLPAAGRPSSAATARRSGRVEVPFTRRSLGDRVPRARLRAGAGLGAPARPPPEPALLRAAAGSGRLPTGGCGTTRCATSRCPTRRWIRPAGWRRGWSRPSRRSCASSSHAHWRLFRVRDPLPLASRAGARVNLGPTDRRFARRPGS